MVRPKGSKNAPGTKKPGRKPQMLETVPLEEVLAGKVKILQVLADGEAMTISDAARKCGIKPTQAWKWVSRDKDFHGLIDACRQVFADDLEQGLRTNKHFIPQMMMLKGYRPMFRDSYKFDFSTEPLEKLLREIKDLKKPKEEE